MLKSIRNSIKVKLLIPIMLGSVIVALLSVFVLQEIKVRNTTLIGVTTGKAIASQIFSSRDFYSQEILPSAKAAGMSVGLNHENDPNELPVPATFVKLLTERIGDAYPGSSARMFSEYPFQFRVGTADAELDPFEKEALTEFKRDPSKPYSRLVQHDSGKVMHYIQPIIMEQSCVDCHNTHPQSTKTDWQVGDVRGGLEIVLPLSEAEAGLDNATIILAALMLGGFALVAGITLLVMRNLIFKPLAAVSQVVAEVQGGDLTARTTLTSDDEFGVMARNINAMLDVTSETIVDANFEKEMLQESIFELLNEVADVADGNLSVEAKIPDGELGPVANSFNYMIAQLRSIINDVQEATLQVSSSANEIQTTAEHLAMGSESQASQILDTSAAIDEMTISIQQVSENAQLSAEVGKQARSNAEEGAEAVRDTIDGMQRIRSQVEDTTKRIRRLGESSQRVGEIVELIDDIADRTSILALNAAIEADLAGEAGVSFAVVAAEVESLADRSTQATQQIAILIRNIQSEINEAITAMETTSLEAAKGSELALDAGQRLQVIETVSDQLVELINSISLSAKQQARGSETIARSMSEISDVTQQTAAGTKEATASIGNLAMLADELRASVSMFKLPESAE